MKKIILILLTIVLSNSLFSQSREDTTEFTVINILGAEVYEKPTFNSEKLTNIPVGQKLTLEKAIDTDEKIVFGTDFCLSGKWIKPKELNGFVFSSDLTNKKVKTGTNEFGQKYIDILGKLISKKEEEKDIKTDNGVFPKFFEYRFYENGKYTYTAWDGCFDHVTEYHNFNINEVYHQMVSDYGVILNDKDGSNFWVPKYENKTENILNFESMGATQELKIKIISEGIYEVSSYDCT